MLFEGARSVVVEVFTISDLVIEREIYDMEIEAGYFYDEVTIQNERIGIYLYNSNENLIEVKAGDWVSFFREKK